MKSLLRLHPYIVGNVGAYNELLNKNLYFRNKKKTLLTNILQKISAI